MRSSGNGKRHRRKRSHNICQISAHNYVRICLHDPFDPSQREFGRLKIFLRVLGDVELVLPEFFGWITSREREGE